MKEATGELNMTLVTVIAVAAILTFAVWFVPQLTQRIQDTWSDQEEGDINPIPGEPGA